MHPYASFGYPYGFGASPYSVFGSHFGYNPYGLAGLASPFSSYNPYVSPFGLANPYSSLSPYNYAGLSAAAPPPPPAPQSPSQQQYNQAKCPNCPYAN